MGFRCMGLVSCGSCSLQALLATCFTCACNCEYSHQCLHHPFVQVQHAMGQQQEFAFADLLTVVRPAGQRLIEDKEGHKLVGKLTRCCCCACLLTPPVCVS